MTFFERLHLAHFDKLYGFDEKAIEQVKKQLADMGMSDEEIAATIASLQVVSPGRSYGHAHSTTAAGIIEQAFFRDFPRATSLTLRIIREDTGYEWDGHLEIEVVEIEREQPGEAER